MTVSKADLIGAWRLISATEVFTDGERRPEFGPGATGYLCYSPDGIVSATLGSTSRTRSEATDPTRASDDDLAGMARGFISYAGPFTVGDDGDGTGVVVTHHIDVALFTGWEGGDQVRHVRLVDGELHILASPRSAADGREFRSELVWRRVTGGGA